jgi:glycosyltransferase involved in cell wall biosynthesis
MLKVAFSMSLKITLIATTYNAPRHLRACLESIAWQRLAPYQLVIGDDGSKSDTKEIVDLFRSKIKCSIDHIWHEDIGHRLDAIRNKSILAAKGDYIILIDGDMILHQEFIADHARAAHDGHFVCGSREYLTKEETETYFNVPSEKRKYALTSPPNPLRRGISGTRTTLHSTRLSELCYTTYSNSTLKQLFGANLAFWREDAIKINGFNEEMVGWGRDDNEFAQRLVNIGCKRRSLIFSGLAQHLWHPETTRAAFQGNFDLYEKAKKEKLSSCKRGINEHANGVQIENL